MRNTTLDLFLAKTTHSKSTSATLESSQATAVAPTDPSPLGSVSSVSLKSHSQQSSDNPDLIFSLDLGTYTQEEISKLTDKQKFDLCLLNTGNHLKNTNFHIPLKAKTGGLKKDMQVKNTFMHFHDLYFLMPRKFFSVKTVR